MRLYQGSSGRLLIEEVRICEASGMHVAQGTKIADTNVGLLEIYLSISLVEQVKYIRCTLRKGPKKQIQMWDF